MKKFVCLMLMAAMMLVLGSVAFVQAAVISPSGEGQIGVTAVVASAELPVYEKADTSSKTILNLVFGSHIIVTGQENGWARIVLSDSEDAPHGWVKADSLVIDPAYYMTEGETPVYAWDDTDAPQLAVLGENTLIPVLNMKGEWVVVGVNGISGWIHTETSGEKLDGERYVTTIMIEGMEEEVYYEHIINDALGFEMDYDYQLFVHRSDSEREIIASAYDNLDDPADYLEITCSPVDAETAADTIGAALSENYEIYRDTQTLDLAGECICIDASADKGGKTMPENLVTVYIIPAEDGCRIATLYYTIEDAEGMGVRVHNMMNTFEVIDIRP